MLNWKKIAQFSSIVLLTSTTILATLLVKYNSPNQKYLPDKISPTTYGEHFFDDHIAWSNSRFVHNNLLFPSQGKNLDLSYIILRPEDISFENILKMLVSKKSLGATHFEHQIVLDLSSQKIKNKQDVLKLFKNANAKLFDFKIKPENQNKKLGLFYDINIQKRTVIIEVYELAKNLKVEKELDKFLHNWTNKMLSKPKNLDFIQILSGETLVTKASLQKKLWLDKIDDDQSNRFDHREILIKNKLIDGKKKQVLILSKDQKKYVKIKSSLPLHNLQKNDKLFNFLLSKNIIATQTSTIDLQQAKMKIIFNFYEVDLNSEIVMGWWRDFVYNPVAITKKVFTIDIPWIFDQIKNVKTIKGKFWSKKINNDASKIPNVVIFKKEIFDKITNDWIKFINLPLIGGTLEMLNQNILGFSNIINSIVRTTKALEFLKNTNLKINNQEMNAYQAIFNHPIASKKNKTGLDLIIEQINNSKIVQPIKLFEILFKDFKGDKTDRWASINTYLSATINNKSLRDLYHLIIGWSVFENVIYERIFELHSLGLIKQNPYQILEDDYFWLQKFLKRLKRHNIIGYSTNVQDIIKNPLRFFKIFLNQVYHNNFLPLTKNDFQIILSLLPLDLTLKTQQKLSTILGDFFADKKEITNLALLIFGNDFNYTKSLKIYQNPWQILELIADHQQYDQAFVKRIGLLLFEKQLLNQFLKASMKLEKDLSPLLDGFYRGFDNENKLKNAFALFWNRRSKNLIYQNFMNVVLSNFYNGKWTSLLENLIKNEKGWFKYLKNVPQKISPFLKKGLKNSSQQEIENFWQSLVLVIEYLLDSNLRKNYPDLEKFLSPIKDIFGNFFQGKQDLQKRNAKIKNWACFLKLLASS